MKLIKEAEIEEKVINTLKQITKEYIDKDKIMKKVLQGADDSARPNYITICNNIQSKITELQKVNLNLYKDKVKEIITEKQFLELMEETNKEKEKYITQIQELNKKIKESKEQEKSDTILKNVIDKIINFEDIDSNLISLLINRIVINLDGSIEIEVKFKKTNV